MVRSSSCFVCSVNLTKIISVEKDSRKDHGHESKTTGCAGQAADAVSAYTQVKMKDAPTFLKNPKSECLDIWISLPKHKWPKSWSSMEGPAVLLERNQYGHPLAGPIRERQFEKVILKRGWEKFRIGNVYVDREKGLLLWGTERSGVSVTNWQNFGGWSCVQIMSCCHFGSRQSCAQF